MLSRACDQTRRVAIKRAHDALSRDNGFGPGVIEVRYDEPRELEGSYSLYFKVERLP